MLVDEARIFVASGKGGDGMVSFRREKYVPRGGPSGGAGGRGGDVLLKADANLNTLFFFRKRGHFKAKAGGKGGSSNKTGADADGLVVFVPPGTVVRDAETGGLIADLVKADDEVIVVRGGRGGRGNVHFKTAANQAPRMAEKGEPGVERWLTLELKMIADVALVGLPNAGKSTLLSVVSNAKPKIADYPFTTLEPNLGTVVYDNKDLVFADVPGLIEGAHLGVGLGHAFLRHVQRTDIIVHILDGSAADPLADYNQIRTELALYDANLAERPEIVAVNKIDLPEAREYWALLKESLLERDIADPLAISALTRENVERLIQRVFEQADNLPQREASTDDAAPVYELDDDGLPFELVVEDGVYFVSGDRIERAAAMTYWDYDEAVLRFHKTLETLGVVAALAKAGVKPGDTVYVGDFELEWSD
ncbi:MAG: GTPase ObgE [Chloroflexota bacterium]|nr:GTPase ObgE [Chloroflexota bacterium]MDE2947244.1 GTPase ObgE [Chloroflexota bacterium]